MGTILGTFVNNKDDLVAVKENIVMGKNFRFSILSERLIRIEYSKTGEFVDKASANVIYRKFPKVKYTLNNVGSLIQISTIYFTLDYVKDKAITKSKISGSLQVKLNGSDKVWYYGHPEARNYGSINYSLDDFKKNIKYDKGLYSTDGFVCLDDSMTYLVDSNGNVSYRDGSNLDLYLFVYKKDLGLCLQDYYKLTGYPMLIPRYALGTWWYKNKKYDNNELNGLIGSFHEEKISLGGVLLGDRCFLENDLFTFDGIDVTNFKGVLNQVYSHLGVVINPKKKINKNSLTYNNLENVLGNLGNNVDLLKLDDSRLDNLFNYGIKRFLECGVDSFYVDYNNINDKVFLSKLVNYIYLYSSNISLKRSFIIGRNHGFAVHKNMVVFVGNTHVDWNTLEVLPRYFSQASNSGISFVGAPIGGFYGGVEDFELYIRYIQLGVFSSLMVLASDYCKYYRREPWRWGTSEKEMIKKYLNLRTKLIPYIYTECYYYSKNGSPLIQPLYYKYPKIYDEPLYKNQYFFGSQMLVCPITKKKNMVMNRVVQRLFIPEGTWYEFDSGKKYAGNKYYMSFYRDEDYPVFCREGAIIVMSLNSNTELPTNLEVNVFPGCDGSYLLYEDDGYSYEYRNGNYSVSEYNFFYEANSYEFNIRNTRSYGGFPSFRNYKIVFKNTKFCNVSVFNNGTRIDANVYSEKNNLIVEVLDVSTSGELLVKCDSDGMLMNSTIRLINDDIRGILEDLEIETTLKDKIDEILFSDITVKKKRIAIRKLKKYKLEPKFIKMFLNLLEYIKTV